MSEKTKLTFSSGSGKEKEEGIPYQNDLIVEVFDQRSKHGHRRFGILCQDLKRKESKILFK